MARSKGKVPVGTTSDNQVEAKGAQSPNLAASRSNSVCGAKVCSDWAVKVGQSAFCTRWVVGTVVVCRRAEKTCLGNFGGVPEALGPGGL